MNVLSFNCGSSSIKFQLFNCDKRPILQGTLEKIGLNGSCCTYVLIDKEELNTVKRPCPTHKDGFSFVFDLIQNEININNLKINAMGHRVVHGGERYKTSTLISRKILTELKKLLYLAPLHNPPSILGIETALDLIPQIPHVAVFDTAWHQTIPPHIYTYSLPYEWYQKYGIRKYGFHGLSFLYVSRRAASLLRKRYDKVNQIICHIGNGSSINAIKNGVSYDTSMGFSPLGGLVMGSRAGDHDAAIDFYIMEKEGLSATEIYDILNKKSGILGLTGKFMDRRDVLRAAENNNQRARLALEVEGFSIKKYIGAYYAILGKVDAITFTGGVGEMVSEVRAIATKGMEHLGIKIDPTKNRLSKTRNWETEISASDSKVKVFVVPTDEEMVIAEEVVNILRKEDGDHSYNFQEPTYENPIRKKKFLKEASDNPDLIKIAARRPTI